MTNIKKLFLSLTVVTASSFLLSACTVPFIGSQSPTPTPIAYGSFATPTPRPTAYSYVTPTRALSPVPTSSASTPSQNGSLVTLNTSKGQIVFRLYNKEAPKASANFVEKIKSSFYNNLTFHRAEPGLIVQGGDPKGDSTGGGSIVSEFNNIKFKRGSLGLVRGPERSYSNDSQFFICLSDDACSSLDGDYVNFGEVVQGMENVDKIRVGDKITSASADTK